MTITKFLKEKFYLILLAIIISSIYMLFFSVIHSPIEIIITVQFLFWTLILFILCIEYARRVSFYRSLMDSLNSLDKKFLITEIIKEPEFMDGQILYETLQEVNRSMNNHVNEYRYAQEAYKDYVELWVHEIKTPLAAAKLIITNNDSPATKSIEEEINKVEGFVDQALFYARSNTAQKDYIIKKMTLSTPINHMIKKNAKSFIFKNIRIQLDELDKEIYSDIKWVEFIVDQIIANSLKYSSNGTQITIYAESKENQVCLYIKDEGCGILPHDLSRVFDKGFTGSNGRTHEKATGMGLYLCKKLCDKLYLPIDITSSTKGTCVKITFPISNYILMK